MKKKLRNILLILFIIVCFLVFFAVQWLFRTWPNLKMDELIYQLTAPVQGTGNGMYWQFFYQVGIPVIICLVGSVLCIHFFKKNAKIFLLLVSVLSLIISVLQINTKLDVKDYLQNKDEDSTFIEDNYVDPSSVNLQFPEKKRNLITIYLESMEMTYADKSNGGGFEENFIPNLTNLSEENENFSDSNTQLNGAISLSGTTWTMGGLFASTSGLPLIVSMGQNVMDTQDSFFSDTTVLGDILADHGYTNVFACGSDATFGGRRLYYQTHGNYEIHDLNYRKETGELPEDYYVWWGFEDEKLIQYAKEDLTELASQNQPFNYSMLTADTHFEDGYVCDLCEDEHSGNQYGNVISCSDRQVSELVSWIQQQDWYENTTIVITGDHPTMDSDFCNPIETNYQRRVYTAYINAQPVTDNSTGMRTYSTFDTFPTMLSSLGVIIEGNRLGLGTDLFSGEKTLLEKNSVISINTELSKNSLFMDQLIASKDTVKNEKAGVHVSVDITEKDQLHFVCSDVYGYQGTLKDIEVVLGERTEQNEKEILKYSGNGVFEGDIRVGNIDISNVSVQVNIITDESKETAFSYQGNLKLLNGESGDFGSYIDGLKSLDTNRYVTLITIQGNTLPEFTESNQKLLSDIGCDSFESGDASYCVIDHGKTKQEHSNDYLREKGVLKDGTPYVISSSSNDEQVSSILLGEDYIEYSYQQNGLNFVVWDSVNHCVVSQNGFSFGNSPVIDDVSVKTSLLNSDVEVIASNPTYSDSAAHIVAVMYDENDASDREEKIMSLNFDNTYICTFQNVKKDLKKKTISVYATFDDGSRKLLGTWRK